MTSTEEVKYKQWKRDSTLVDEKSPGLGIALGLLPGFGSFYVREPVYGVLNLLTWPLSILWDPISGYNGAKAINYQETLARMESKKEKEIQQLEIDQVKTSMDDTKFLLRKMEIQDKYK